MSQFFDHTKEVDLAGLDLACRGSIPRRELDVGARTFVGREVSPEHLR
jgi:hypothetical protein